MKFRRIVAGSLLSFAAVLVLSSFDNGPSYADQMAELIQQRDAGLISREEYWSVKKQMISVMLH